MSKIGISIGIDVTKIDKLRLKQDGEKIWMNLTTYIDTENAGKFGDHGFIAQSTSKEEKESGIRTPILGNCKVFFKDDSAVQVKQEIPPPISDAPFDDDIPF
jgi:hypothetical protein